MYGGECDGFPDGQALFGSGSECEGAGVEVVGEGELFGGEAAGSGSPMELFGAAGLPVVFSVRHLGLFSAYRAAVCGRWGLGWGDGPG
ncbi:hypothetical protein ADK57_13205, partial [Streptomyces sp. MMG1533]